MRWLPGLGRRTPLESTTTTPGARVLPERGTLEQLGDFVNVVTAKLTGDEVAEQQARARLHADELRDHVMKFGPWLAGDALGVPPLGPSEMPGYGLGSFRNPPVFPPR